MNFSEASRVRIPLAEVEIAMTEDANACAVGYAAVMRSANHACKFSVLTLFLFYHNHQAWWVIVTTPLLNGIWVVFRACMGHLALPSKGGRGVLNDHLIESYENHDLIASFVQRDRVNDRFAASAEKLRSRHVPHAIVEANCFWGPKWIGIFLTGAFIVTGGQRVLDKEFSLGTFLATISVIRQFDEIMGELLDEAISLTRFANCLARVANIMNAHTDTLFLKNINRHRRSVTHRCLAEAISSGGGVGCTQPASDSIPIKLDNVSFTRQHGIPILSDINLQVNQGSLVAIVGAVGSGRRTFMGLLGNRIFPAKGSLYVPSHLRVLLVSHWPMFMDMTPWENLTFGVPKPDAKERARIKDILVLLEMKATLELVKDDLQLAIGAAEGTEMANQEHHEDKNADFIEVAVCKGNHNGLETAKKGQEECTVVDEEEIPWRLLLTDTERTKMNLARAFIMNPEVLVLHKPLHHFDEQTGRDVLQVIKQHVKNRGLCVPEEECVFRRLRTCFFNPLLTEHAELADTIWMIDEESKTVKQVK
mmetsp:Transcript_136860/g.292335  ORF Transcript_136860/g.292335 Transcript_136860/m.292335 type:complete len:535 (-) Transcript_136860:110-1714(-)